MSYNNVRPMAKPKDQGTSASLAATVAAPIAPDYPHDTFKAPATPHYCESITPMGAGTRGETGAVRSIRPRC